MSTPSTSRVTSVDLLRGLVIVIMALDHTRDYFHFQLDPTDIPKTTVALFMTRWITHFCAPVFMALAGVGAFLGLSRGKTRGAMSRFLVTRGVWLVILELTVVKVGWFFNADYHVVLLLVIWALGWSMIALAGLIWIPRRILTVICLIAIVGHNALDDVEVPARMQWLWTILHEPGGIQPADGYLIFAPYVLVPWMFVMALGYCAGPIFQWTEERRRRVLLWSGIAATAAFVIVRGINAYGDPNGWTWEGNVVSTTLSFLNCTKYPPSLDYLLMTLGPAGLMLVLFEHWQNAVARVFLVFGRVPMFFYLLHIYAIHAVAVVFALTRYDDAGLLWAPPSPEAAGPFSPPPGYGYSLWVVYAVWIGIVAGLYPLCRWFAEYKRTHKAAWLSFF